MNWIGRKIHLYNVTMGLYMLDWWERYLFNILMVVLLWFICYNTWHSASEFFNALYNFDHSRMASKFLDGERLGGSRAG